MLTVQQLVDLAVSPADRLTGGRVLAIQRAAEQTMPTPPWYTEALRALLDRVRTTEPTATPDYPHPIDAARYARGLHTGRQLARRAAGDDTGDARLDPADIAWIQRLPEDPEDVTWDDAIALAGLAMRLTEGTPDRRLLDSVWTPVREVHDRRAAQTALTAAQQPVPALPVEALPAVTEAVQRETPALSAGEARERARVRLEEAHAARRADAELARQAATERLAALDHDRTRRQRTTAA